MSPRGTKRSGAALLGGVALAVSACAPEPEAPVCEGVEPRLAITTGLHDWRALEQGDAVTIVHGPQDGWHILAGADLWGLSDVVESRLRITELISEVVVADAYFRFGLLPDESCASRTLGLYGFLDVAPLASGARDTPPELLGGRPVLVELDLLDEHGAAASGDIVVTAEIDPADGSTGTAEE